MQGLEFIDVPGLVILATGAGVMGTMLLAATGWGKRDRAAVQRLHIACAELKQEPYEVAAEVAEEEQTEVSCTRELLEIDYDEVTKPVLYTSADMALCENGGLVKPVPIKRAV